MRSKVFLSLTLFSWGLTLANPLSTKAAQTDYKETGRYDEVIRLCGQFQKSFPQNIRCEKFGVTPEGRPMLALIAQNSNRRNKPVVFFQGGIHAGEIDGKDAGFWVLEETLNKFKERLDHVTLVFVPVLNIDGHERFGKYNRPNQIGPEEMGWRTTAQNLNLNRDYMKADAPEMRNLLKLLHQWDPIAYLDLHVTDGAEFQHDISVIVNPSLKGFEPLRTTGERVSSDLMKGLTAKGNLPVPFYPSFVKDDEPSSGFEVGISPPRFSQSYWGLNNRMGFLVETHSWKPFKARVLSTKNTLDLVIDAAVKDGLKWMEAAKQADKEASQLGGKEVVIHWDVTQRSETIDFLGYRYEIKNSPISQKKRIRYFSDQNQVWKVPFFSELEPTLTVVATKGGYVVPPSHQTWVSEKLKAHGIQYEVLKKSWRGPTEVFRAEEAELSKASVEGRQTLSVKGQWKEEEQTIPYGSLWVPINQKAALVVLHLFEPKAKDSFLSWGYFNAHFERKEYMEDYVAEAVAEEMLGNPKIRAEFEEKLKDKTFASDPDKRLEFFYQKHPSYDQRYKLYPVYRTNVNLR